MWVVCNRNLDHEIKISQMLSTMHYPKMRMTEIHLNQQKQQRSRPLERLIMMIMREGNGRLDQVVVLAHLGVVVLNPFKIATKMTRSVNVMKKTTSTSQTMKRRRI